MDCRPCCTIFFQTSAFNSEINQKALWLGGVGGVVVTPTCSLPNVHPADILTGQTSLLWFPTDFDSILKEKNENKYRVSEHGERIKSQKTGSVIWWVMLNRAQVSASPPAGQQFTGPGVHMSERQLLLNLIPIHTTKTGGPLFSKMSSLNFSTHHCGVLKSTYVVSGRHCPSSQDIFCHFPGNIYTLLTRLVAACLTVNHCKLHAAINGYRCRVLVVILLKKNIL